MVLVHRVAAQVADPTEALEERLVVDHDGAIPGGMDVQFHPFAAQGLGPAERSAAVLVLVSGRTTVSDTQRSSHEIRMSGMTTMAARKRSLLHPIYLRRPAACRIRYEPRRA